MDLKPLKPEAPEGYQPLGAVLTDLTALGAPTVDGQFIVATGVGAFAYESGNTTRTSLGLGTGDSPTWTGATITGNSVFGLNSSVFQPTTDSTTFFQIKDAAGAILGNWDTTNKRFMIGGNNPAVLFHIKSLVDGVATDVRFDRFANTVVGDGNEVWFSFADAGTPKFYLGMNDTIQTGDPDTQNSFQIGISNTFDSALIRCYGKHYTKLLKSVATAVPDDLGDFDNYNVILSSGGGTGVSAGMLFSTSSNAFGGSAIVHYDKGSGGIGDLVIYTKQAINAVPPVEVIRFSDIGFIGVGPEPSPETLTEWTHANPDMTWHGFTHSDLDNATAGKHIWKREDGAGTETACFQFEASHDGSGANDQLGKGVWSVNTGAGLVQALEIGSDLLATFAGAVASATLTFSTVGPTDNVDVSGINTLFIDNSSNAITIGGFAGGVDGQVLHIALINAGANNVTLEHNEAEATQKIFLHAGVDETLNSEYGGWVLVCHGGVDWHDNSHSRHV